MRATVPTGGAGAPFPTRRRHDKPDSTERFRLKISSSKTRPIYKYIPIPSVRFAPVFNLPLPTSRTRRHCNDGTRLAKLVTRKYQSIKDKIIDLSAHIYTDKISTGSSSKVDQFSHRLLQSLKIAIWPKSG